MSQIKIRAALETALNSITPSIACAWENVSFTPPASSVPYQQAHMIFARPANIEAGSSHQELGFMQIKLMYPENAGPATATARAELLRTTFRRAASFVNSGVTVSITDTPEITRGEPEDGRFVLVVKIRFRSFIPS